MGGGKEKVPVLFLFSFAATAVQVINVAFKGPNKSALEKPCASGFAGFRSLRDSLDNSGVIVAPLQGALEFFAERNLCGNFKSIHHGYGTEDPCLCSLSTMECKRAR